MDVCEAIGELPVPLACELARALLRQRCAMKRILSKSRKIRRQGFLGRLLGRADIAGFVTGLENALMASRRLDAVDEAAIHRLMKLHKVRTFKQVDNATRDLVERLALTMRPDDFGGQWEQQLRSLAKRLKVPDETVVQAIKSAAKRLLREACERGVVDGNVTSQETQELISLRQRVGLDEREHTAIFLVAAQTYAQQLFEQAMADGRLNPQEESELAGLAQALGVAFDYDQVAHKAIENARKRWQIEHGVLSTVAAPINLQRGERCYAWLEVEALESRERTISTRYGGPAVSFRIMKGVYYRAGAYRTERTRESYHHSFGIGSLCVTSRRLVFSSPQKGISIPWGRILDCVAYVDGVEVRRGNGKPLVFLFRRDDEFFLPILNRAMSGT
jgi:hypothetical protein